MARIAACGGVYSNPHALAAFVDDARRRGADRLVCLGDLGGYGAEVEAVWPLLVDHGIECIAGNYELAIAGGLGECGCGYRDPLDNHYAQLIYDFTAAHTSPAYAAWMGRLATERRQWIDGTEVHLVHGSPLGVNDFWWESRPEAEHRARAEASGADVVLCTHSGLPWQRRVGRTLAVNVGVLGKPANNGRREVSYALVDVEGGRAEAELVSLAYDWPAEAASMRQAGLPELFVETIETGWWTTCIEVLPPAERARGRYQLYRAALPALLERFGETLPVEGDPALTGADRPVVALFGTPVFPRRLWVLADALAGDGRDLSAVVAEARADGFTELIVVGATPPPDVADHGVPGLRVSAAGGLPPAPPGAWRPELVVTATGVCLSPGDIERPAVPHPSDGWAPLEAARTAATQRFLEAAAADGTVAPVPTCVL